MDLYIRAGGGTETHPPGPMQPKLYHHKRDEHLPLLLRIETSPYDVGYHVACMVRTHRL